MSDLVEFVRLSRVWGPVTAAGATLLGYGIPFVLPVNIEPPILSVSCGLAVVVAAMTALGWQSIRDGFQIARQREDAEWDRLLNAGTRNPDTTPNST
jgi:hypothetical protein